MFLGSLRLLGNTGLLGGQDVDLTVEVKLSCEEKMNPEFLQTGGLQARGDLSSGVRLPNTGLF